MIPLFPSIRSLFYLVALAMAAGEVQGATLYGFATDDSMESKWTTGIDLFYQDGVVDGPDVGPATWMADLPERSGRNSSIGTGLLSVSMGGYGSHHAILRQVIQAWSSIGFGGSGIIGGGRHQNNTEPLASGYSSGNTGLGNGTLVVGNSPGSSVYSSVGSSAEEGPIFSGTVVIIPEPSTAIFGVLGCLGLLRRRRIS
jgi:hypothetical protein